MRQQEEMLVRCFFDEAFFMWGIRLHRERVAWQTRR
jgi:hypothetical protein